MLWVPKYILKSLLNAYPRWICTKEYKSQTFTRFNERPIEYAFLFRKIGELYPQTILDVGTGITALPHLMRNCGCLVTATDNVRDYWTSGIFNRHYHVINDDITATRLSCEFDLITCISVLEHIQLPDIAIHNMFNLLNPKGYLILTFPYNERRYVKNVYELKESCYGGESSYITQSYSRNEINRWIEQNKAIIIEQEYWQFWTGEYWTIGEQIIPPKRVQPKDKHQLACILLQKS